MRCFIDMDGVLVDFVGGAQAFYGRKLDPYPAGDFDIVKALGMSSREFWNGLDESYWANLPMLPDAALLLQLLEQSFGTMNLCLLTSPSRDPRSLSGKLRWIQKHLKKFERRFLIGPPKEFCAHPGSILFDDSDGNVDQFRRAGGAAVLVPRPWNRDHAIVDAVAHVQQCITNRHWHAAPEEDVQPDLSFDFK